MMRRFSPNHVSLCFSFDISFVAWFVSCLMCLLRLCLMCMFPYVVCAGFCKCYVHCLVCVLCSLRPVLCAVFSPCYVQSLVCVMCSLQWRASSLRSEHASLPSVGTGTRAHQKSIISVTEMIWAHRRSNHLTLNTSLPLVTWVWT